jgi:carboxypeptidase E
MQDFNYLASNAFELTLELGCRKFPPGKDLANLWNENHEALLNFMWQVELHRKHFVSKTKSLVFFVDSRWYQRTY